MSDVLAEKNRRLEIDRRSASLAATQLQDARENLAAKRKEILASAGDVLPMYADLQPTGV